MSDWLDGNGSANEVDVVALLGDGACGKGVAELVDAGALVAMGKTRDGGALGVTVTVDGRFRRDYFRNEDELLVWLAEAIPGVEAAIAARPASGVPDGGTRRRRGL